MLARMETSWAAPAIRKLDAELLRLGVTDPAAQPASERGSARATGRRPSPEAFAALAVLAGVGAIALGAAAVVTQWPSDTEAASIPLEAQSGIALLSKPSTQRVPFAGSHGTAVLAVGSGGRAAIVLRGFAPAATDGAYDVWARAPGRPFVRVGTFAGTERIVLLSARLDPGSVVGITPRESGPPTPSFPPSLVAQRP